MRGFGMLPDSAAYCYMFTDPSSNDLARFEQLHPLEKTLVSQAVDRRKAEFGDARWCAHQALEQLGAQKEVARQPILRGERGAPIWPEGYTGSMTHTDGYRAAVVAPLSTVRSVGVDAEPAERLPDGVLNSIALRSEIGQLTKLVDAGLDHADRLLFCAKEATYKAWFPLTRRFLDFHEAEIDLRADGTFFSYLLVRPTPVPFITGTWMQRSGFLITTAVVQ